MSNSSNSTRQVSATQWAVEKIRDLIFSGELSSDGNYLESVLANRLGISRTPVREAILILQTRGLLEVQPRKGVRINSRSINDIGNIYTVLTEIECLAIRLVANANYSEADLAPLVECNNRLDAALTNNDLKAWLDEDERFHVELASMSRNEHTRSVVENLNDQIRRSRVTLINIRSTPLEFGNVYRNVYDALLSGEADRADSIHRLHRKNTHQSDTNTFKQHGLKRV